MQDIHDINGLIEILPFWREHLIIILGALLCLGIAFFFYLKKRKTEKISTQSNLPKLSSYEQAIEDLKAAQEVMKPGMDKLLSTKCSDIIRKYLEEAFHFQTSKTTEEFLNNIKTEQTFHGKSLETLATFLEMCDLAKFAKIEFTYNEQKALFEKAHLFLELAHQEEVKLLEALKKKEDIQSA